MSTDVFFQYFKNNCLMSQRAYRLKIIMRICLLNEAISIFYSLRSKFDNINVYTVESC